MMKGIRLIVPCSRIWKTLRPTGRLMREAVRKRKFKAKALLILCMASLSPGSWAQSPTPRVDELSWLAGHWRGEVPAAGAVADLVISEPASGTLGMLFRWQVRKEGHVHHAVRIVEEGADGAVTLSALHIFRGFSIPPQELDRPTRYRLARTDSNLAVFECLENCEESHSYHLRADGTLEVSFEFEDASREPVRRIYRRVSVGR